MSSEYWGDVSDEMMSDTGTENQRTCSTYCIFISPLSLPLPHSQLTVRNSDFLNVEQYRISDVSVLRTKRRIHAYGNRSFRGELTIALSSQSVESSRWLQRTEVDDFKLAMVRAE